MNAKQFKYKHSLGAAITLVPPPEANWLGKKTETITSMGISALRYPHPCSSPGTESWSIIRSQSRCSWKYCQWTIKPHRALPPHVKNFDSFSFLFKTISSVDNIILIIWLYKVSQLNVINFDSFLSPSKSISSVNIFIFHAIFIIFTRQTSLILYTACLISE